MAGDKEVKYEITGNADGLASAMSKAQQVIGGASEQMKSHVEGIGKAFEKVNKVFLGLAAVAAGGAFFKECIGESRKLAGEVGNLSKRLGITTDDASALNTALGDINSDSDTYIGAFDKFAQQLRKNESGLQDMGLKTRDANGHLRDSNTLFREALGVVGQYKPGLDQTTAAMSIFGKSVEEVMSLQKLNNGVIEEARQKNEELGLTITQENLAASKRYAAAMNDLGDVMTGIKNSIGQAVMPVFAELGEYLSQSGPYMVSIFKGAMSGLLLVFRAVQMAVKIVAGAVFEAINTIIDQVGNIGDMFSRILHGDWDGAVQAAKAIGNRAGEAYKKVFVDNVKDAYAEAVEASAGDMARVWGKGTSVQTAKGGNRTMAEAPAKEEKSEMPAYEQRLVQAKLAYAILNQGREMDKAEEGDYWKHILNTETVSAGDQAKIRTKTAEIEIEIMRRGLQQQEQLAQDGIKRKEDAAMAGLEAERNHADSEVAMERMTATERAQLEVQFEDRRHAIQLDAQNARLALLENDPTTSPVELARVHTEMLQEEAQYQNRRTQLQNAATLAGVQDSRRMRDAMTSGFQQVIDQYRKGTLTLAGLFRGLAKTILDVWIQMLEEKAAKWLAEHVMEIAGNKVAAVSDITASAAAAGAAGTASFAGAPWPIDLGAAAYGASMYAAALSYAPAASAAGGYDIPDNVNPITQLHAREMVLPAKHADVIRSLSEGGGGGGGDIHFHGQRLRGGFFMAHQDDLVSAIKDAKRGNRL